MAERNSPALQQIHEIKFLLGSRFIFLENHDKGEIFINRLSTSPFWSVWPQNFNLFYPPLCHKFVSQLAQRLLIQNTERVCCLLFMTQLVSEGPASKELALEKFSSLLDHPSTSFNLSVYSAFNAALMQRGTYKADPSISPIHLMSVRRHPPSLLTSLSGRWLDRLTPVCREDG